MWARTVDTLNIMHTQFSRLQACPQTTPTQMLIGTINEFRYRNSRLCSIRPIASTDPIYDHSIVLIIFSKLWYLSYFNTGCMPDKLTQAIKILKALNQPDRVINRDRINFTKFMHILGNPFQDYKCIHVTGTNGKGSVSIKTASILQNAGYRVGVYTSPHLFSFR